MTYPPPPAPGPFPGSDPMPPQGSGPQQPVGPQAQAADPYGQFPPAGQVPPGPGATPAEPQKKNPLVKVLGGLLVPILAAVGLFIWRSVSDPAMPDVGKCVSLTQKGSKKDDVDFKKVDCSQDGPKMAFQVAKKGSGAAVSCPDGDYLRFTQTRSKGKSTWACLMPEFKEDKCYDVDPDVPAPVDCSASEADVKVTKVIEGTNDESQCTGPDDAGAYTYSDPKRAFCLAQPA